MVIRVGINGFGRIGRVIFRTCFQNHDIELSAINDPAIDIEYICYLMKFDSTHGKFRRNISHNDTEIFIDEHVIKVFREKLPTDVPWHTARVQYVVEASGMFTCVEKASGHLKSEGVKRVIVTAPSVDAPMIILGVNDKTLMADQKILSCASSTLYCLAPIVKVLNDHYGVSDGFITSIHAMTPSLKPLDGLCLRGKHWRDHRSIHQNIIPATTGACKALGKIIPQLKDKMGGLAFRVPIVNVSVLDITIRLEKNTSMKDIIKSVEAASKTYLNNILKVSNDDAVSSDFIGDSHSCVLDIDSSLQLKPNFYKLICWYENEYSYACRVLDSIFFSETQFAGSVSLVSKMTYVRPKVLNKQDEVLQTENNSKEISIECDYNNGMSKILCTTSHNDTFRRKPIQKCRPVLLRKQILSHNTGSGSAVGAKKRTELFKVWNDDCESPRSSVARQNKGAIFRSCITFSPNIDDKQECMKAQARLEDVKKQFSKMLDITENLLKNSYSNVTEIEAVENTSKQVMSLDPNAKIKLGTIANTNSMKRKYCAQQPNSSISKECGDYKNKVVSTPNRNNDNEIPKPCHSVEVEIVTSDCKKTGMVKTIAENSTEKIILKEFQKVDEDRILAKNELRPDKDKCSMKEIFKIDKDPNNFISIPVQNNFPQRNNDKTGRSVTAFSVIVSANPAHIVKNVNIVIPRNDSKIYNKKYENDQEDEISKVEGVEPEPPNKKVTYNTQKTAPKINEVKFSMNNNMQIIDEELKIRKIVLVNSDSNLNSSNNNEQLRVATERDSHGKKYIGYHNDFCDGICKMDEILPDDSVCVSRGETATTVSIGDRKRHQDIYEKLDSTSATDSNNSFEISERKSQILQITDLTNSLEDLSRLDKICRIIEISDELSDELFSGLDTGDNFRTKEQKWSFKDFCEKIQLDEFCNKVFGKTSA